MGLFHKIFGITPRRAKKLQPGHRFQCVAEIIDADNSDIPYKIKLLGDNGELTRASMYISREEQLAIETLGNPHLKRKLIQEHVKALQKELELMGKK